MNLSKVENAVLGETYYFGVHSSGLRVILIPKKGSASTYAVIGAKCGSLDSAFKIEGDEDFVTVPDGIAHFLEHKMFECEDGDAFLKYSKTGASANAFTSFDKTCYLFSCTHGFYESLDILLDFVQRPYFTEETVKKEQGIIGQEIKMYEDSPGWELLKGLLNAVYRENPVRTDIAGTVESISHITADLLYRCYGAFYNPANMTIAVCGDIDVEKTAGFISERIRDTKPKKVVSKPFEEPDEVSAPFVSKKMQVSIPMMGLAYKDILPEDPYEAKKRSVAAEIILEALFGEATDFYCSHYDKGDINTAFEKEYMCGRGFALTLFEAETRDPEKLACMIKTRAAEAVKDGISPEDFNRAKRRIYGDAVSLFDSVERLGDAAVAEDFSGNDIFSAVKAIEETDIAYCNGLLPELFREKSSAVSAIYPIDGEKK